MQAGQRCCESRRFERLLQRQRRQNRRQSFREHRLACARRADEQDVVPAGSGDFLRAFDGFLAFHIGEIELIFVWLIEQPGQVNAGRVKFSLRLRESQPPRADFGWGSLADP